MNDLAPATWNCGRVSLTKPKTTMKTSAARSLAAAGLCALAALSTYADSGVDIKLKPIGTYATGIFDEGAAEIVAYDAARFRVYSINAAAVTMDVLDISRPKRPRLVATVSLLPYGGALTSVSVKNGVLAVAVPAAEATDPGKVVFFNSALQPIKVVDVGVLPDMLTWTPDGKFVLTANEGQPAEDYSVDPEGSVSIIDVSAGVANATVRTADFTAFNSAALDPSIRIFGRDTNGVRSTVAQDLEPEYITVSANSKIAWVSLQENNAIGIIDIEAGVVTSLVGLGFKDHSLPGNAFDASDRDGAINIANWPVLGMYQPDAIANYVAGGQTYLLMVNEGDSRAYAGFNEETRVASLTLDPAVFPNAADLKKSAALGRLRVTNATGDTDNDGDFDAIHAYGARSFTIRNVAGGIVFDSGSELEQLIAAVYPTNFNASSTSNTFDDRSDDKGPEPEGVTTGFVFGRQLAFIALERIGGIVVYDVTNPADPSLLEYVNNRSFQFLPGTPESGDQGPEGLVFVPAHSSPNHKPLLLVANEVSGSVTIFEIRCVENDDDDDDDDND